ncbi:hypothetical protein ACWERI_38100 [Streptomyces collinus]
MGNTRTNGDRVKIWQCATAGESFRRNQDFVIQRCQIKVEDTI